MFIQIPNLNCKLCCCDGVMTMISSDVDNNVLVLLLSVSLHYLPRYVVNRNISIHDTPPPSHLNIKYCPVSDKEKKYLRSSLICPRVDTQAWSHLNSALLKLHSHFQIWSRKTFDMVILAVCCYLSGFEIIQ